MALVGQARSALAGCDLGASNRYSKKLEKALSVARYGHLRLELRRFGNLDKVRDQAKLGIETCKK
jgi:hypothetical protein